jgi:GH15 family glucan-1,4-alpha-glucosidase
MVVSLTRAATTTYTPIKDFGLIGDLHTAALVSKSGSIDWCCWPDFDSPAVFCKLLDAKLGGSFAINPLKNFVSRQSYIEGTNLLQTSFETDSGRIRVTDFMPVGRLTGDYKEYPRVTRRAISRLIEGLSGEVEIEVNLRATFNFARSKTEIEPFAKGGIAHAGDEAVVLYCPFALNTTGDGSLHCKAKISEGDRVWLHLSYSSNSTVDLHGLTPAAYEIEFEQAIVHWRDWSSVCTYEGDYSAFVQRSALVLKLLTYAPTGAIIAAPTTSLPETPGGIRNWDYRYTWLRDSSLIVYALQLIGYYHEASAFLDWLNRLQIARHKRVQIMYSVRGEDDLTEQHLQHLEGYCNSQPVRIGNAAYRQQQYDIYGEVLDATFLYHERVHKMLPKRWWDEVRFLADEAARCWSLPDNGIWEFRTGQKHFLYSKLLCWVALDRAIKLGIHRSDKKRFAHWVRTRDQIREVILDDGYNQKAGAFTQVIGGNELDATALMIPLLGLLPATDERVKSTLTRIDDKLSANGLVYRYLTDDGLPGREATFGICSFWLVDNLALAGRIDQARDLFERLTRYAGDLHLFSEQIEPESGQFLGNYPQGFTHLALIRSAFHIAKAEAMGSESTSHDPADRTTEMEQSGLLPRATE